MKIRSGDMWQEEGVADIILVTTNSTINKEGKLVMGRGAAYEAASRYPLLPHELAEQIKPYGSTPYGILIMSQYANGVQLGAFQVKRHWRETASVNLIDISSRRLGVIARAFPSMRFVLNYPGIGNGRLSESEVEPIIEELPDNVIIYKKPMA